MAMLLAGCKNDDVNEQTVGYRCANFITSVDGKEAPVVSNATYSVRLNYTDALIDVQATDLKINGADVAAYAVNVPMKVSNTEMNQLITFSSQTPQVASSSERISALKGELPTVFFYETTKIPGVTETYPAGPTPYISYIVGGTHRVRTFAKDPFFRGTTVTKGTDREGVPFTYENKDVCYHAVMNFEKKTADIVLYRAKFAEAAPAIPAIVLRGLKIEFNNAGYIISGENIVPETVEGSSTTPNERFMFNSFELRTTSENLVQAKCTYKVAGVYEGEFSGSSRP